MLKRLFKYEFKATYRPILMTYGALIALFAVYAFAAAFLAEWVKTVLFALLAVGSVAAAVIVMVILISRFARSMFGAEGYLTHTLPVKPWQLMFAKTTVSLVWSFFTLLMTLVLILGGAVILEPGDFSGFGQITTFFASNSTMAWQTAGILAVALLHGMLYPFVIVYFIITLVNTRPFHKGSVGFGILAYMIYNFVSQLIIGALTVFAPLSLSFSETGWRLQTASMFGSMTRGASFSPSFGLSGYLFQIAVLIALAALTIRLLHRRLSLK